MSTPIQTRATRRATGMAEWLAAAAAAVWTTVVVAGPAGPASGRILTAVTYGVPLALGVIVLLVRRQTGPVLARATMWTALVALGLFCGELIEQRALYALAVPGVVVVGLLAHRRPAVVAVVALLFSGAYNTVGAYTSLPIDSTADLLLAALWASVVTGFITRRAKRPLALLPGIGLLALYLALTALAAALSEETRVAFYGLRLSAWYATAILLAAYAPWSSATYHRVLRGAVAVTLLIAGYAVLRLLIGPGQPEIDRAAEYTGGLIYQHGELRLFGSFPGRHLLGAWSAVAVPFCVGAALALDGRWRIAAVVASAFGLIALFGSDVRTALAAVVIAGAVMLVLYQMARGFPGLRLGAVAVVAVLAVAGGGGAFLIATDGDTTRLERYSTLTSPGSDESIVARTVKWEQVLADAEDKPLGHGVGTAGSRSQQFSRFVTFKDVYVDNSYLTIAYEQGLTVMGLFMAALALLGLGAARRAVRTEHRWEAAWGIAATGALVGFAVMLATGPYLQELTAFYSWFIVGIGMAPLVQRLEPPGDS